eukprot:TRINITY_DN42987_c0_g1_i1.p1 TRINITY_DN42987_c0_g1~~TRINITY_DN42987_c0_g1_i1.p1  ORF type:complete len:219 (-),score=23.95 TRINITY_DN42987_c0_g1_i1:374-1030(-)
MAIHDMPPKSLQLLPRRLAASLRFGWLVFVAVVGLTALRRWLLSKQSPVQPPRNQPRGGPRGRTSPHQGLGSTSSGPSRRSRGGARPTTGAVKSRESSILLRPALEAELGPTWHFQGRRRWLWLHNGETPNGWIELGQGGSLQTSFGGGGAWEIRRSGELVVTFGRCHHVLRLMPERPGAAPMFMMQERIMKDGSAIREKYMRTKGRLDMSTPAPGSN